MGRVDLNVDIGEGMPYDAPLLRFATSANVGCGAHAGSPELTREVVLLCRDLGVAVGAHPGYPDREAFGRAPWDDPWKAFDSLLAQTELLAGLGAAYVKPHGAFYNQSAAGGAAGDVLEELLRRLGLPLLGLPGGAHEGVARRAGVRFAREGFADRLLLPNGMLVPRSEPGAVVTGVDAVCRNALALAPLVDSICLHGDTPGSVELAGAVRRALEQAGFEVAPWL
ncbi:MAG: LamB/YcsF family protein [Armatimonadetes bacterium]|nr:LamB/YcsF family protein [Armatimonadota bacterium]